MIKTMPFGGAPLSLFLAPVLFVLSPALSAQTMKGLEEEFIEGARKGRGACVRVEILRSLPGSSKGETSASSSSLRMISVSGILLSEAGEVATVGEALVGAERIWVEVGGSKEIRRFKGGIVGYDLESDVGLVRILSDEPFHPLPLGDSDRLQPGALVMCMAYTWGMASSPSFNVGVVNAVKRPFKHLTPQGKTCEIHFIQTSLPLHPGETGGPVLDRSLHVVGMLFTSFPPPVEGEGKREEKKESQEGRAGFFGGGWTPYTLVMPINRVKWQVKAILAGEARKGAGGEEGPGAPWLGLQAREITDETLRIQLHLPEGGVLVSYVFPDDPAGLAGIRKNDILKAWNHVPIRGLDHLGNLIRGCRAGDRVKIEVLREGKAMEIEVKIGGF